mgnify:CR=1 FL=1
MMLGQEELAQFFAAQFIQGHRYRTIVEARQQVRVRLNQPVLPGSALAKQVDEAVEAGLVRAAREIVAQGFLPSQTYELLVDLHDRQPNLSVRSSTSVRQQAYSTVLPIAYLAATLAGIDANTTVYEPTAGHGALLLCADPAKTTVNELNPERAADLRAQGFSVTQYDAADYLPKEVHDVVIANPPFGRVKGEAGRARQFTLEGNRRGTAQIDQAISLQALRAMKPNGRAVLILGGKPEKEEPDRSESYNTLESRRFFYILYQQYNVTAHFTVAGELYRKQGAAWPIDLIVIQGRGRSSRPLPAVQPPLIYTSFITLKELLSDGQSHKPSGLSEVPAGLVTPDGGESKPVSGENPLGSNPDDVDVLPGTDGGTGAMADRSVDDDGDRGSESDPSAIGGNALPAQFQRNSPGLNGGPSLGVGTGLGGSPDSEQRNLGGSLPGQHRAGVSRDLTRGDILPSHPDGVTRRSEAGSISGRPRLRTLTDLSQQPIASTPQVPMADTSAEAPTPTPLNTAYVPRSQGPSPGTLIPTNMAVSAQIALERLEKERGNIDEFVMSRLGFDTKEQLWAVLYAEQIDSLALAFDQRSKGRIFLNSDQTGNGKGRFGAANLIDARRQGYG